MKFNTHNRTPKIETKKSVKILLYAGFGMVIVLFLFVAIVCSVYINSVMPAVVILAPIILIAMFIIITQKDMDKAFVEVVNGAITVTDYYFGIKKEKVFSAHNIGCADIFPGYSMRVRGYRYSNVGTTYIVFFDKNGRYMFKILCVLETKEFFGAYLNSSIHSFCTH